ncbi:MAG: methylmalonyl Co-A mutase-associated GTPase MeaB [Actinobacteria bacterium]|nr:methylmalonyl Co-A mutase-associated GTPase MeaB [Actinomycetota bacterium]MBT3746800.1 methylmalonyl Co-A mutase-associated GTPase MeaB [Actinomycetota bacterium]MBT3969578.1 methylmalonyl Co-A mutase-associated GTPase MeaB [Actinomycetota bacterium]MBT4010597.1 methylmalonyl Co-A mutase-associated GTPase MeaB [Actinomycetota bacterium]MBT4303118.1 methylmalonyl Co-A mutase-associated GTPase MeaB [Actinomycetota bacterium]
MSGALDLPQLVALASEGNRRAVGRLLSVVEQGGALADTVTSLTHQKPSAHVVGFTGAPGAGKSTLIGQLVHHLCQQNQAPAVLAVDPSSPLTGGAILGDRIRMDHLNAGQAFIRSAATRGHQGGLALSVPGSMRVFSAAGYHPVIIETVGVGQVEVDVAAAADTTVVVVNPGWGDAVQANKSGLLEVADIFVINKADRPGAQDTRRDLELMLELSHVSGQEDPTGYRPPIIMATATTGDGIAETWTAITLHLQHLKNTGQLEARRQARIRYEVLSRIEQKLQIAAKNALTAETITTNTSPAKLAQQIVNQLLA